MYCCSARSPGGRSGTSAPRAGCSGASRRSGCARAQTGCVWTRVRCSRSPACLRRRMPSPPLPAPRAAPSRHLGCRRTGAPRITTARQEAVVQQELRTVVGELSVHRPLAEPLEPRCVRAVDAGPVDVARDRVDLLPRRRSLARIGCGGRTHERDVADGVREGFGGSALLKGMLRGLTARFETQAERVIHELPPTEAPLGDPVLARTGSDGRR